MPLFLYCALIALVSLAAPIGNSWLWVWSRKARKVRRPVRMRLLRAAGTSLREKLTEIDESLMIVFISAVLAPSWVGFSLIVEPDWWKPVPPLRALVGALLSGLVCFGMNAWLLTIFRKRSDYLLGHSGEIAVAEHLQELARGGCYVFHDLQPDKSWNIDHIVVAPDSVLVVETKARRMRGGSSREPAHKVTFDGRTLHFPNWSDSHGISQAERNAAWVREHVSKAVGEPVKVEPVLALPGWMVQRTGRGNVYVVNPKEMKALVRARGAQSISPDKAKRMAQIAFALEQKCRDVEF